MEERVVPEITAATPDTTEPKKSGGPKTRQSSESSDKVAPTGKRMTRSSARMAESGQGSGPGEEEVDHQEEAEVNVVGDRIEGHLAMEHMVRVITQELRQQREEAQQYREEARRQHEETRRQLEETRQQLEDTKVQMAEELRLVREQLDTLTKNSTPAAASQSSPWASYVEVARTPPSSQPSALQTISSRNSSPSAIAETLYCTIDSSRVQEEEKSRVQAGNVRKAVEGKMRTWKEDSSWRCKAVTVDAKYEGRVKIVCRDEAEHNMVKKAVETAHLADGVRVLRDELFPVKVDNVNRTVVLDVNGNIRPGAAEALGCENQTTVAKISWLSRKEVPKAYGSMVVYLTKAVDARRILEEGYFHAGGESGHASVFERRPRPEQCYNCQEIGHKAFKCRKPQRCARCAKEGHRHDGCNDQVLKCALCGGPHESFSKHCRKLYPGLHE